MNSLPCKLWFMLQAMDVGAFTRELVISNAVTGTKARWAKTSCAGLSAWVMRRRRSRELERCNILATSPGHPNPTVVFSTHMDTLPPFIPSWEDWGEIFMAAALVMQRIIAAQLQRRSGCGRGVHVGLLFLVGKKATAWARKSRMRNHWLQIFD